MLATNAKECARRSTADLFVHTSPITTAPAAPRRSTVCITIQFCIIGRHGRAGGGCRLSAGGTRLGLRAAQQCRLVCSYFAHHHRSCSPSQINCMHYQTVVHHWAARAGWGGLPPECCWQTLRSARGAAMQTCSSYFPHHQRSCSPSRNILYASPDISASLGGTGGSGGTAA